MVYGQPAGEDSSHAAIESSMCDPMTLQAKYKLLAEKELAGMQGEAVVIHHAGVILSTVVAVEVE